MKLTNLKPGSILSETSFYVVKTVNKGQIDVVDDHGNPVTIGDKYAEQILVCADYYEKEEKKTSTELADLFINSPRIAMTVCFITKGKEKTKTAYEAEKKAKIDEIQNASLANATKLLNDLIEHPITRSIPGGERVMKGRHYGHVDEFGRIHFTDMEIAQDKSKDYDVRKREVDPRTIQWLIINKVKYSHK